ncbi:MAG: glycosyltransferase family 2 protein [Clostridia bacterium]|nr:glycosyltransferase family 2 protein [Clostridia bacterium]
MDKLLSVIMPIYNGEKYLSEAIESILNQSYSNIELILVNDGSTDNTLTICQQYAKQDKRIFVLNQKNMGGQIAKNNGIDIAKGDYICFIDSDDYISPSMFRSMIDALEYYNADFSFCQFTRKTELITKEYKNIVDYFFIKDKEQIFKIIIGKGEKLSAGGYVWNKIYKKSILKDYRFDSDINIGEDGLFNLKLAKRLNSICGSDANYYYYRLNPVGLTAGNFRKFERIKREYLKYCEYYDKETDENIKHYISFMIACSSLRGAEACVRENLFNQNLRDIRYILKKYVNKEILKGKPVYKKYKLFMLMPCVFSFIIKRKYKNKSGR